MKKILIEKDEDIADAIDRILAEPSTSIVLVVPRGSTLGRSVRNFHLLRREMTSAGRQIEVESVDEQILALAKEAKIPGRHPLLNRTGGSVSDIVAAGDEPRETEAPKKRGAKSKHGAADDEDAVKIEVPEESAVTGETSSDENEEGEEGSSGRKVRRTFGRGPFL